MLGLAGGRSCPAAPMRTSCLAAAMLARMASCEDDVFSTTDVSALMSGASDQEDSISIGCQPDGSWGAYAPAPLYDLPGAGTAAECQDIAGARSVCSTPELGASGCELLVNSAGCTCKAFCEHHGLVCEASWDDNFNMCIKRTDDQRCEFGSGEQICLCAPHTPPPLVSVAELVAIIVMSTIVLVVVAMWCYCHGKVPECKLWVSKREKDEQAVRQHACLHLDDVLPPLVPLTARMLRYRL